MQRKRIVDHWTFWVYNKGLKITESIRIEGCEANNLTDARKAARSYGAIQNYVTIYKKD